MAFFYLTKLIFYYHNIIHFVYLNQLKIFGFLKNCSNCFYTILLKLSSYRFLRLHFYKNYLIKLLKL